MTDVNNQIIHLPDTSETAKLASGYKTASPFAHIVLDGLFNDALLGRISDEITQISDNVWKSKIHANSRKFALQDRSKFGPATQSFFEFMNSELFLDWLTRLTGIDSLIADKNLEGGGIHRIKKGGFLDIHADFNWHKNLKLFRRLNVLVYLNQNWKKSFGGHLELWDKKMKKCEQKVLPTFNRMVIFSTTSSSHHGHPTPLTCPEDRERQSLALYYYSKEKSEDTLNSPHSTLYKQKFKNFFRNLFFRN